MEAVAPSSMHNTQHLDSTQLQVPHGVQVNHDRGTLPVCSPIHFLLHKHLTMLATNAQVVDVAGPLNNLGWSAVETMNLRQGSEVTQATEVRIFF